MMLRITLATETTKPGLRGEHEGNRNTIAQGRPDRFGEPVVTLLACFFILHARLRVRKSIRLSLRPLHSGGTSFCKARAREALRECGIASLRGAFATTPLRSLCELRGVAVRRSALARRRKQSRVSSAVRFWIASLTLAMTGRRYSLGRTWSAAFMRRSPSLQLSCNFNATAAARYQ